MRSAMPGFALSLFFVFGSNAQSPTDGKVAGNQYVNSYFHISYAWPKILQPYDTGSLQLPSQSPYSNEFLLFSARQGGQPYGVVILAERLNFPTPHSKGIRDAAEMMNMITRFRPDEHAAILSRKHLTTSNGLVFDEVEYTQNGEYSAGIVTPVGQYMIVFKCNARSAADLAEMSASALALLPLK